MGRCYVGPMSETLELTLGSDLFEARLLHSRVVAAGFDAQLLELGEGSLVGNRWAEHKLLVRKADLESIQALLAEAPGGNQGPDS